MLTYVCQTKQHERDSKSGVGDADQSAPERLWCDVSIAYKENERLVILE